MNYTLFAVVGLVLTLSSCTSKSPRSVGDDAKHLCPGIPSRVRIVCGCDPKLIYLNGVLQSTDLREDVKLEVQNCLQGDLAVERSSPNLSLKLEACVSQKKSLDANYQKALVEITNNALTKYSEGLSQSYDSCYRDNLKSSKLEVDKSKINFNYPVVTEVFTVQNQSDEEVPWMLTNPPLGFSFNPNKGSLKAKSDQVVSVYRLRQRANAKSFVIIRSFGSEDHKIELEITDGSLTAIDAAVKNIVSKPQTSELSSNEVFKLVNAYAPSMSTSNMWMVSGELLYKNDRFGESVYAFNKALKADPLIRSNPRFIDVFSKAQYRSGAVSDALDSLKLSLAESNGDLQYTALINSFAIQLAQITMYCSDKGADCKRNSIDKSFAKGRSLMKKISLPEFTKSIQIQKHDLDTAYGKGTAEKSIELIRSMRAKELR